MDKYEKHWTQIAKTLLLNKTITEVRYMSDEEVEELGIDNKPIQFKTSDGHWFTAMGDDEGNGGGSLHTNHSEHSKYSVIPTL